MTVRDTPTDRTGWRPVLAGPAAEQARAAVEAIAASLAGSLPAADDPAVAPLVRHVTLDSGRAGLALFYAYLARSTGDSADIDRVETLLASALDAAPRLDLGPSLCSGVAGLAWAAAHLRRLGLQVGGRSEPFGRRADERLLAELDRSAAAASLENYDLLYGLVGIGVAALERLPEPSAATLLARIVERLAERAERRTDGVTWWTAPEHTGQPENVPHGWYNLGLAHGVPGVIGLLGLACAAGVATFTARPLLDGAVAWLLARRRQFEAGGRFPPFLGEEITPYPARLAWCYGDPGVAAVLLVAARAVGQVEWERQAVAIALDAADQAPDASGVVDAPLCHGAIGLGHVFNRLFQSTGEPRLAKAARSWLERGLALRRPGGRLGGFHALVPADDGSPTRRVAYRGIVQGAVGIGLALLAATTDVEPAWDRLLLVN